MKISNLKSILEIEEEFSKLFPYLRLKMYKEPTDRSEGAVSEIIPSSQMKLASVRKLNRTTDLEILPSITMDSLEKLFVDEFNLHIKLFRKSGKEWIETKLTGHWTLEEQNREGAVLSNKNQAD